MKILIHPNKILTQRALPVETFNAKTQRTIHGMLKTLYRVKGIGLAANQVGILKRIIVIKESPKHFPLIVINPYIREREGEIEGLEDCLSIPGYTLLVKRSDKILLKGYNHLRRPISIRTSGFLSRVIQHEVDHLQGITILDYE